MKFQRNKKLFNKMILKVLFKMKKFNKILKKKLSKLIKK